MILYNISDIQIIFCFTFLYAHAYNSAKMQGSFFLSYCLLFLSKSLNVLYKSSIYIIVLYLQIYNKDENVVQKQETARKKTVVKLLIMTKFYPCKRQQEYKEHEVIISSYLL